MKALLEAKNISKAYPSSLVLQNVSLSLFPHASYAIMGASGEGKTTLLHILGGLEKPDQGIITFQERPIESLPLTKYRNSHIGFIFQSFNLLEDLSVMDNVLLPFRVARHPIAKDSPSYNQAKKLLQEVGLSSHMNKLTKYLSGGEKQRAAIARAFCHNPDIILADEPSGNLDHHNSAIIHELLLSFSRQKGKTLVIVTHDRELAALCDTILILSEGKLLQEKNKLKS
ncbi:MAG: ABC transporter ATP-binding protein [Parachlamydiales bacterium]|nr:ABC transporter ATP-binding protein [Parachlamydiales bacterium]